MDKVHDPAMGGARFFGEMSASITHEIKNVLAIINENAGLLQDLLFMHVRQGKALDTARLSRLSRSIQRQVTRGDRIAQNLNRFAHSTDAASEKVDVAETACFMVQLGQRLLEMKGIEILIASKTGPLRIVTNRFFLENLLWCCLYRVLEKSGSGQTITMEIDGPEAQITVRYHGISAKTLETTLDSFATEQRWIAGVLGIEIIVENEEKQLRLIFQS